jgi:hypothetical protein
MDHLDEKVNGGPGPSMEITDEVVSVRDRKRSFLYINSPLHIPSPIDEAFASKHMPDLLVGHDVKDF